MQHQTEHSIAHRGSSCDVARISWRRCFLTYIIPKLAMEPSEEEVCVPGSSMPTCCHQTRPTTWIRFVRSRGFVKLVGKENDHTHQRNIGRLREEMCVIDHSRPKRGIVAFVPRFAQDTATATPLALLRRICHSHRLV